MKLLHVIPTINPEAGGAVEGMCQMVSAVQLLGHTVEVATIDDPGSPWLLNPPFRTFALGPGVSSYQYSRNLKEWLNNNASNYDAIIVEGLWQYNGYAVWKTLRTLALPYFVFTHGALDPWFKNQYPFKHLKKWLYWPWGQYPILRDAKAVLFTCEEECILARQSFCLYKANEVVVGYGTSKPIGDVKQQRELFLSEFPELEENRLFLFLSRIHEKKGCDLLIKAFSMVASQDQTLHLVIAGPDQTGWKKELVELSRSLGVETRITWTGMLSGDLKWGAYHAAEAFVLPSHQENFGVVVAEALACGVPTLISNKVNIWREVSKDSAGIVAVDNLEGTIALFDGWLKMDNSEQMLMRKKAIACFNSRFEMARAARNFIDVVEESVRG